MDSVTTLQCQNLTCLAPNSLAHKFCEKCGTPLVKRYLWMLGDWVRSYYPVGALVDDRYLVCQPSVVLDTKPAQSPRAPDEPPLSIAPYLKLFPHRVHVPQIYGYIPSPDERLPMDVWLLEYGTVPVNSAGELLYPELLPTLLEEWDRGTALKQLNWLWQIAHLWQPFQKKIVVSSLLNPSLLRVNGGVVQLLELSFDEPPVPQLSALGELWGEWIGNADERVRDFLASLCEQLRSGEIDRPEYLISALDGGLQHYGRSRKRLYHLYTCTDTGPVREHNEDACYPEAERAISSDPESEVLAIVCDGIGGQEGGEIASSLAIETLQEELTRRSADLTPENPQTIEEILNQAIGVTNDAISQRNDSEQRKERQRMGTTLVMNLAKNHEMYVAHVGDSRVYRITPHSCHQVTVDDDLASREVKLGYLLYRDAVQYPNAGALVQALGMSGAATLHPNVQRWILDEDCVFLLCSDGLSDHDRVEQYWDTEIVPLLTGEKTVSEVGRRLLELANQKNGHDNATIALVHCQLQPADTPVSPLASATVIPRSLPEPCDDDEDTLEIDSGENTRPEIPTVLPTVPVVEAPSPVPQGRSFTPTLIAGAIVVAVVGVLGAIAFPYFQASPPSETPIPSQPSESPPPP